MASFLYRTRGMLQFPRYVPTLVARAQASQNNPSTSGQAKQKADSSVLPPSGTSSDHTNPTKTSSDAPALDHETVDIKNKNTGKQSQTTSSSSGKSSSSGDSKKQQSFLSTPAGQIGIATVLAVTIYGGYKMMSGGDTKDLKKNEHYKRATADYQAANTQGTDVKK